MDISARHACSNLRQCLCYSILTAMQLCDQEAAVHNAHTGGSVRLLSAGLLMTVSFLHPPLGGGKRCLMLSLPLHHRAAPLAQRHAEGLAGAAAASCACRLHSGDQPVDTSGAMGLP